MSIFENLDIQSILLLITLVMNTILGGIIFLREGKDTENRIYVFNIAAVLWWVGSMLLYRVSPAPLLGWTLSLYLAPTFIASSFFFFALLFPQQPIRNAWRYLVPIGMANVLVALITAIPGLVIVGAAPRPGLEPIIYFGPLYPIYASYISLFFSAGWLVLAFKHAKLKDDRMRRRQVTYLLIGYTIASTFAMVTNLILPYLGQFEWNWLGQVLTLFMVIPVTYAIFKHRLFDVKVIATELLTISLWLLIFIRTLLSNTRSEFLMNGTLLIATFVIGLLLIRSVDREVEQRERLEELTRNLEAANTRLRELDRQKSEFLAIAAHQLRTPLAAVKGYTSMMLEGSYGVLVGPVRDTIKTIFDASDRMADTVDDFLNVSRIEQGRMEYRKNHIDLAEAVKETVQTFQLPAREKNLALTYKDDGRTPYVVCGDASKIQHVINNLIDNAIKYTKQGSIHVSLARIGGMVRITVADSGAGIPKEAIHTLFDKFVRARNAKSINVTGSGLGLYVAREMIRVHGGKIWAESDGEGKGARFIVELPLTDGIPPDPRN